MKPVEPGVDIRSDYYICTPSPNAMKAFFYPIAVGHFIYQPGYHLKRSSYDSFLIMLVQKGECTVRAEGIKRHLSAGQAVLLDCYALHEYESATGWEALWLHYDGIAARSYYDMLCRGEGPAAVFPGGYAVDRYLSRIYQAFHTHRTYGEALLSRDITILLTELLTAADRRPEPPAAGSMDDILHYISAHLSEALTVEGLASQAHVSPYHFIRVFKQETGYTPHEYIITARMNTAKFLLKTTATPVKEISYSLGFSCEAAFCAAFKKHAGCTPLKYRRDG
ncbi:helix-turn-helix transcriptional regulator [Lachnotalea sp. AF33-28]|uniref:helix-turn-helix transcriptional regulator n=1 Tax=Lachnotalea sp. AF33-28 TaxID=2292046 RepID=UPI0013145E55|nr:AraC family transcriptional regulator [Lachnotalea sp. AF33-28]